MRRRTFVATLTAASVVPLAGCQDSTDNEENGGANNTDNESDANGDGENGAENGTDENGTEEDGADVEPPEWLDWIPATTVRGQSVMTVIDTDEMREDFPDTYESSPTADIPEIYGVEPDDMERVLRVERGQNLELEIITGSFDTAQMLDTLGVPRSNTSEYGEFKIVTNENGQETLTLGDSAIIVGEMRNAVDAKTGDLESLGVNDQEWRELFADVSEETMIVGGPGDGGLGPSAPFEFEKTLITYSAGQQRTTRSTGHFVFSSADRAAEILDTERETLVDLFRGETEGTIESVEQRENRLVLTLLTDEPLLGGGGGTRTVRSTTSAVSSLG